MSRSRSDDGPTQLVKVFRAFDFVCESLAASPMMIAVVFQGQHYVLPSHVEVIPPTAIRTQHRNLRPRSRVTGANYQQAQPRFLRRLGAGINEVQHRFELA